MTGNIFDFVIVGAGSAGCVMAERLSKSGQFSVALIEAGGSDRRFFIQMPLGYGKTFYDPTLNWGYIAQEDQGLNGRREYWPRGKVLGGSSSINAMVWIRGDARDFDEWGKDNPGWTYADCLKYFKEIEDNAAGADDWRGAGGDVHVCVPGKLHPLAQKFLEACGQAGFAANPDFNGAAQEGVGLYQVNIRNGRRMSAARACLKPALKRPNLALFSETLARKLMFDGARVSGVEIERGSQIGIVQARREVILAAGAVNSPQLLQLSGLGPANLLRANGVQVRADLPVGRHLQDHLGINYTYRAKIPSLNEALRPLWGKALAGLNYLARGQGPLSLSLNQAGGFVRTRPQLDRPNIQLYLQAISTTQAQAGTRPLLTPDPFPGFSLGLSNCKPTSRGEISISSADPQAKPVIVSNAYQTDADIDDMLEGVKLLRHLAAQPALANVIADELAPGEKVQSDQDLISDFRARSGTVYHPCGTCRMGPDGVRSVVDQRMRVHGIAGLRVADASIFPSIISGNLNAPVMMVGAKAAAMILEDAR